ncbi:MAG: PilZ domain-containing protein [Polyangiaceae bacterium]
MTQPEERRDPQKQRKSVSTLVEVCGNIPGIPVFEAESVDVSPHGMHLRTAYLPEEGAPLVCRFESDGREIVVEGMVAWRREGGRGGEFGVKFTALDSRSVDALKGLCGAALAEADKAEAQLGETGARVRLHIDGLGSPMKARVKTGGSAKLQVGSSLEFLKVGKRLELEDLEIGERRAAEIDGVSVVIDPSTQVPQLVVALRFEGGADSTPSPSVADVGSREAAGGMRIPGSAVSSDMKAPAESKKAAEKTKPSEAKPDADEDDDDSPEMRGRLATMAAGAEEAAKHASEKLARASAGAAQGALSFLKSAGSRIAEMRQKGATPPRRTTSPAPGASGDKPKLRPQSGGSPSVEAAPARRFSRRTVGIAAGVSLTAAGALAFAMRAPSASPPGDNNASSASAAIAEAQSPTAVGSAAPDSAPALAPGQNGVVTANVPLFGPTPLATTEPAPLGPTPGTLAAAVEASERADAKQSLGSQMRDESFSEESDDAEPRSKSSSTDEKSKSSSKPEDVAPWGHGKMHEPTIYRVRLDAPGEKLVGTQEPTGFNVLIPSRKLMEAAAGIAKRDERIARVRSNNGGGGAQLSFRFKDEVPSYRVRLRKDYVEILLSAPSKEKDEKAGKVAAKAEKSDKVEKPKPRK